MARETTRLGIRGFVGAKPVGEALLPAYGEEPLASDLYWQWAAYLRGPVCGEVEGLLRHGGRPGRAAALLVTLRDAATGAEVARHPYSLSCDAISGCAADLFSARLPEAKEGEEKPILRYEITLNGAAPRPASRVRVEAPPARFRFEPLAPGPSIERLADHAVAYGSPHSGRLVMLTQGAFETMERQMEATPRQEAIAGLLGRPLLDAKARVAYVLVDRVAPLTEGVEGTAASVRAGPEAFGQLIETDRLLVGLCHSHPGRKVEEMMCASLSPVDYATVRHRCRRAHMVSLVVNVGLDGECTHAVFGWLPGTGHIGSLGGFYVVRPDDADAG